MQLRLSLPVIVCLSSVVGGFTPLSVHSRCWRSPFSDKVVRWRSPGAPQFTSSSLFSEIEPEGTKNNRPVAENFLRNLVKGMTFAFPSLRRVALTPGASTKDRSKLGVGLSLKEGLFAVTLYLVTGVLSYSYIFEKWSIVDAFYFSCVCLTTVGYGDLSPTTPISRAFTCVFGLGGIAFLGAAVATIGSSLLRAEAEAMEKAKETSKDRVMGLFDNMPTILEKYRGKSNSRQKRMLKGAQKRKRVYEGMVYGTVEEQEIALWSKSVVSLLLRSMPSLGVIFGGGLVMKFLNKGWTYSQSAYFAVITASTIGFGDLAPQTREARLFAIAYVPLAVAAAGELLSAVALSLVSKRQRYLYEQQLEKDLTLDHLLVMDNDGDGKISREEYVQFMLIEMGRVDRSELDELYRQFMRLDVTRSGYLDNEDLKLMAKLRGAQLKE